jgi:hypothetical protein
MSSLIVNKGYLEYGTPNRSTSYKVEKLIKILSKYIRIPYLVDLILEGLSLEVTMNVLIRNSLIISQNDEFDADDTISRKYVVHNHVNTMVVNFVACTPNPFVFNKYSDEYTLPADIKDFILAENPDLWFGDECELYTLSKGVTVCVGESDRLAEVYAKRNKVGVDILSADTKVVVTYLSYFED